LAGVSQISFRDDALGQNKRLTQFNPNLLFSTSRLIWFWISICALCRFFRSLFNVAGVASPLALSWAIRSVAIATGAALGSRRFGTRLRRNECLFFLLDLQLGNRTSVS